MKTEIIKFIKKNNLSPFSKTKTQIKQNNSHYKTKDAKAIHTKFLSTITKHFSFTETANILNYFAFTTSQKTIIERQTFISSIKTTFPLDQISLPKPKWKPPYTIVAVTENNTTFSKLKNLDCPVKFIVSETDVSSLEIYDIVQVIDCPDYSRVLEQLPQSIFINTIEEVYLERHLSALSGWKENLQTLSQHPDVEIKNIIDQLDPLFPLLEKTATQKLTKESIEKKVAEMNKNISAKLSSLTLSGSSLVEILSKGTLTPELQTIVREELINSELPRAFLISKIPIEIDEEELHNFTRQQDIKGFTQFSENLTKHSSALISLQENLQKLEYLIIYNDFIQGITKWKQNKTSLPQITNYLDLKETHNLFLANPQPISFHLDSENLCSILTGANSGGKTTLLEHIIQSISATQLGLPISGSLKTPLFSEIYYFAKTKGSANKGAFETLLTQMSQISPGKQTLILADEIEAVTEPGVAGKMITATADYFIKQDCFLVIATHLGQEIIKSLPWKARIDGIEAKGLDDKNELIIDHSPILGRLAHSTPELIIEKMARANDNKYFQHINDFLKNSRV